MPLLTELFAFICCRSYKDFAPTELVIAVGGDKVFADGC